MSIQQNTEYWRGYHAAQRFAEEKAAANHKADLKEALKEAKQIAYLEGLTDGRNENGRPNASHPVTPWNSLPFELREKIFKTRILPYAMDRGISICIEFNERS